MSDKLRISNNLTLPLQSVLWTIADLAVKGAGKTYAACVLAEEFVKNGYPILCLDPLGIWWGLRVGADEKSQGLPIVIFGGEHKDIALPIKMDTKSRRPIVDEDKLKLLVKSILETGISAVIDSSDFSKNQQHRIGGIVCEEVFRLNKSYGIRHVFVEEADMLAPQKLFGENAFSLGAVDDLVRRGGNFNIGVTLITQRSAVLNKDVLTQCNLLLALRIEAAIDKDTIKDWVEHAVKDEKERKKLAGWYDTLARLENGEAWVYSPSNKIELTKIRIRKRETLHATREYFLKEHWEQKNVNLMDVAQYVEKFRSVFEPKPKKIEQPVPPPPRDIRTFVPEKFRVPEPETSRGNEPISPSLGGQTPFRPLTAETPDVRGFTSEPSNPEDIAVSQVLPSLELHRYHPTISLKQVTPDFVMPSDYDEPKDTLGRVAVILSNDAAHPEAWSMKRFEKGFALHNWQASDLRQVFEQLVKWEILVKQSNGMYRAFRARVRVVDHGGS